MEWTVRLPLQVGTSSLRSFAFAAATFVPSLLVGGWLLLPEMHRGDTSGMWVTPALVWMVPVGAILYFSVRHLLQALRERPSDVLLSATGLRIQGGRQNGLALEWNQLEKKASSLEGSRQEGLRLFGSLFKVDVASKKPNFWQLWIRPQGGTSARQPGPPKRSLSRSPRIRASCPVRRAARRSRGRISPPRRARTAAPRSRYPRICASACTLP
jgi:hypothetical protein